MLESFLIPFSAIFLAELLDKSQLTILLLSSKTKQHLQLLLGIMAAFCIVDGAAVFFGSFISSVFPADIIRIFAALLFIVFGILSLRSKDDNKDNKSDLKNPLISGFTLVFLSEWGDKTQIAAAVFAAKYQPIFVFLGVISALFLLSLLAVFAGSVLLKRVNKRVVSVVSGIVFIGLGILFLLQ